MSKKGDICAAYCGATFPKQFMTGLNAEQCAGKWISHVINEARLFLVKYYNPNVNYLSDAEQGEVGLCADYLTELRMLIKFLTPILEDMIAPSLNGMDDLIIAQYGIGSDELYIYRAFVHRAERYEEQGFLDGDYMGRYGYEGMDRRLRQILFHVPPDA